MPFSKLEEQNETEFYAYLASLSPCNTRIGGSTFNYLVCRMLLVLIHSQIDSDKDLAIRLLDPLTFRL